jgi:hypothetical protein
LMMTQLLASATNDGPPARMGSPPSPGTPNTVRVNASSPGTNGALETVDSSFDVFASC